MARELTFEEMMARLRSGDEEAAQAIFDRFGHRLIGLARTRLTGALKAKEDPEDVMQSVFKSFFRRQATSGYDLQDWDSLWSLLTTITLRKCGYRVRRFRTARRDARREVRRGTASPAGEDEAASWEAIAREPSPSEALCLVETVEQVMRDLEVGDRTILSLSLQGWEIPEISAQINRAERTVYRAFERIKKKLNHLRSALLETDE